MRYVHNHARVEAIEFTNIAAALEWLKPGEYNYVGNDMVITYYAGDWYRCFPGVDYLVRDDWGVRPMTKVAFEADYQGEE
jgi:hypothetical protein